MEIFTNLVFDAFTWAGIGAAIGVIIIACRVVRPGCCLNACQDDE